MRSVEISKRSGLSQSYISDVLTRRRRPSPEVAKVLESATGISRLAWLYADEYDNPLINAMADKRRAQGKV